jgi:hypothetical protein
MPKSKTRYLSCGIIVNISTPMNTAPINAGTAFFTGPSRPIEKPFG